MYIENFRMRIVNSTNFSKNLINNDNYSKKNTFTNFDDFEICYQKYGSEFFSVFIIIAF